VWLSVAGYSALLALGPVLVGLSLSATTWLVTFSLDQVDLSTRAQSFVLRIVPVSASATAFFLVYRFFPNRPVPARHALAGGVLAALVFEVMKSIFATWMQMMPTYRLVYGAFASIPIFLLWLYLAWLVVLFGAEITAALGHWRLPRPGEPGVGAAGAQAAREIENALAGRGSDPPP
jgi:membrane protein